MKHFIFFFLLLTGSLLHAQKNQIHLNQYGQMIGKYGKEEISQILPNQKILIVGDLKKEMLNPEEIAMLVYTSSQTTPTPVSVAKTSTGYRALIGPFLPRESVGLEIYAKNNLDDQQKQIIKNQFDEGLDKATEDLKETYKLNKAGLTDQEFEKIILDAIKEKLPDDLNKFTNADGQKLKNDFIDIFQSVSGTTDYSPLLNAYILYKRAVDRKNKANKDKYQNEIDSLKNVLFNQGLTSISTSEIIGVELLETSIIVSEIMFHASFDITPALTTLGASRPDSVKRNFGMFFTFSPYLFSRIPPDISMKDYINGVSEGNGRRIFRTLAYLLQPTVGIGIMGNKDVKLTPLVFTGGTLRFNQLFKLTYGLAFNSKEKYNTVGLSININYFSDILKAFQTAQANSKF